MRIARILGLALVVFTLVPASGAVADGPVDSTDLLGATSDLTLQPDFGVCATVDIGGLRPFTVVFTVQGQTSTAETTVLINHRRVASAFGTWSDCAVGGLTARTVANVVAKVTAVDSTVSSATNSRLECHQVAPSSPQCFVGDPSA